MARKFPDFLATSIRKAKVMDKGKDEVKSAPHELAPAKAEAKAAPKAKAPPKDLKSATVKKADVVSDGSGGYFAKGAEIHLESEIIDDLKKAGHVE